MSEIPNKVQVTLFRDDSPNLSLAQKSNFAYLQDLHVRIIKDSCDDSHKLAMLAYVLKTLRVLDEVLN